MAHSAKTLTALGAGIAIVAAAFAGTPATAFERTTGLTEAKPIVLAQAKKKKKKKTTRSTNSGKKSTTRPTRRQTRGSYSGG